MRHTPKYIKGFYTSKNGYEYRVITDKYSGNDYRVIKVYDECMNHIIGKRLMRYHGFRKALKNELHRFEEV